MKSCVFSTCLRHEIAQNIDRVDRRLFGAVPHFATEAAALAFPAM